ncbi:MAG: GTP-binding protein [Hyphomicrobiales bacterium]
MQQKVRNIGILAHVDAGKTTITENFLYLGGTTKQLGSVDKGNAVSDNLDIEKERGISVKSNTTSFTWNDTKINIIDTPGHVDFSAEIERSLGIMDGAILVISAVEGIQAHTISIWNALKELQIPTIVVINKIDRSGADVLNTLKEIKRELNMCAIPLEIPVNEGEKNAHPLSIYTDETLAEAYQHIPESAIEQIVEHDEELMLKFLEGEDISHEVFLYNCKKLFKENKINPILLTVAKNGIGIENILNLIADWIPSSIKEGDTDLCGVVYKIDHDTSLGRIAHTRLFSGQVKNRDVIYNLTQKKEQKITLIKGKSTNKIEDTGSIQAGDIGIICGIPDIQIGDIIGKDDYIKKHTQINLPILTVQVKAKLEKNYAPLGEALTLLSSEDPALEFEWLKNEKEMHIKLSGTIQMEILESIINNRFGIEVELSDPTIIYKETPASIGQGLIRYTMPKPCWAVLLFKVEAGERGSGINYSSEVGVNQIQRKYQNEIERTIPKALEQGIKGWEVTDIKITLVDGEDHEMHSRPGDFILATPMGLMRALKDADTQLLEPVFEFEIQAQEELLGAVASDLTQMRAEFGNPQFEDNKFILNGKVPYSTSMDYAVRLGSLSGGKGKLKFYNLQYQACDLEQGQVREYKGVNPLDTSQWILHARGAFKADEWKY